MQKRGDTTIEGLRKQPRSGRQRVLMRALRLGRMLANANHSQDYVQLARSLGVSRRTLYRDLHLLQSVGFAGPDPLKIAAIRLESTTDILESLLTLREAAALLLFFEQNRQPSPSSAYHEALQHAGRKLSFALRRACTAVTSDLEALIATLDPHRRK